MFKTLAMIAALAVLGVSAANAQQREAVFQKVEVPNASFDIVLATAKPSGPASYHQEQPDPNIVYLSNGLVASYTPELAELLDIATLLRPAHTTIAGTPVVIYVVPKRTGSAATAMR